MQLIKTLALGMVVALSAGMSDKAEAFNAPGYACTAANEGQTDFTFAGRAKYEWVCSGGEWFMVLEYRCDRYGDNCVPL